MKDNDKITLTFRQLKQLITESTVLEANANYTDIVAKIISTIDGDMLDQMWFRVHRLRSEKAAIEKLEAGDYLENPEIWDKYGWLSSAKIKKDMGRKAIWKKLGVSDDEKYQKIDITKVFDAGSNYGSKYDIKMSEGDLKKLNLKPYHVR